MILYLNATSENNTTYTPDWLKVDYSDGCTELSLTLDLQGVTDFSEGSLDCRFKGEALPWVLRGPDFEDDLYEADNAEKRFPPEVIAEIIKKAHNFTIGVYPASDDDYVKALSDSIVLQKGKGTLLYGTLDMDFTFEIENNM